MTLEKTLRDYIIKPAIGLALVTSIYGCQRISEDKLPSQQQLQTEHMQVDNKSAKEDYYFDNFGFISDIVSSGRAVSLSVGDMDGDGDLDIIVGTVGYSSGNTQLMIYENKIPQKNK